MSSPWTTAIVVSAALVVAAPFVGDLQRRLERTLGAAYVPVVNVVVAAVTAAALVDALRRIRTRRAVRYAVIAVAVALAAAYAWRTGLASQRSSAVERFHFVEYGVITWLFYRASVAPAGALTSAARRGRQVALLLVPVACAVSVATADEWLQHLAPGRIGEVRDIFMNVAAIVCGLLVSVAILPVSEASPGGMARAGRRAAIAGAICAGSLAAFVYVVHAGTLIQDEEVAFLSRFDAVALERRAAAAGSRPLASARGLLEDHYETEGIWHVQARNAAWEAGDIAAAWGENRILEKYYASVLAAGHAWPRSQRTDAERQLAGSSRAGPFRSRAERLPILALRR
jgi:hypothetical protein